MASTTEVDEKWDHIRIETVPGQSEGSFDIEFIPRTMAGTGQPNGAPTRVPQSGTVTVREDSKGEPEVVSCRLPELQPSHLTQKDYEEEAMRRVRQDSGRNSPN